MRSLMWGALAAGLVLAGSGVSWASDNVRLGGPAAEAAIQGGIDVLARGGYRGGHHGGYHGGYGRGGISVSIGYGRGYYGGGYYGGGYGRGYYGGYHRPYYASYYYPRSYYSYYPTYYPTYYPSYCYEPTYYYPTNGGVAPQATLQSSYLLPAPRNYVPPMPPAQPDGQYQYDGDPRQLVPMPNPATPKVVPIDGRLVSLSDEITGGVTQIYPTASQRTSTTPATRVAYPAYGEEPITPAPRKVNR